VSPRARRTPLERGVNPRARRTSLEGALCCATLVGRGAAVVWIVLRVCVRLEVGLRFAFLQVLSRIPPGYLGLRLASPALLALRPAAGVRVDSGAATTTTSIRVVCVGARWGRWDLWGRLHELGTCDYLLWTSSDAC
jgi:hypothetical protein